MVTAHLKRIPDGAANALSPLENFRDAARDAMKYMQGLGVDLLDVKNLNNNVSEHDLAAEIARLFDERDIDVIGQLCQFVEEHATDDKAAGASSPPRPGRPAERTPTCWRAARPTRRRPRAADCICTSRAWPANRALTRSTFPFPSLPTSGFYAC